MKVINLLKDLENVKDSTMLRSQIEEVLKQGYQMIWMLRQASMERKLTKDIINEVELFFISNTLDWDILSFNNYSLRKYADQICSFFCSFELYLGSMRSKGKFNLFESLRTNDLKQRGFSDVECSKMIQQMETHWIACNQIFTVYEINKIKKTYIPTNERSKGFS